MGPDTGLVLSAVPETRKCLEAHPQDLLFVFRLLHWLLQHFHLYTIMFRKKQYTEKESVIHLFFVYFCQKKEPNFRRMFCVSGIPEERFYRVFLHMLSLLSKCSLWCSPVYTSFPAHIISFACVYIDNVGRLLSCNHTKTGFNVAAFSRERTGGGCERIISHSSSNVEMLEMFASILSARLRLHGNTRKYQCSNAANILHLTSEVPSFC